MGSLPPSGEYYLPLYRWVEAASSVLPTPHAATAENWMVGVQLAIMGWLWRVFRWIADIAGFAMRTPVGGDDSPTSSLLAGVLGISRRLVDQISIYVVPVALIFVAIGVFRSKKIREGGVEVIKVLLFTALAALMINTSAMWNVLRFSENVLDNAAGVPVDLVENQITRNGGLGGVSLDASLQDPLGCSAYTGELLERAKTGGATEPQPNPTSSQTSTSNLSRLTATASSEPVPATGIHRIVNAWAMWSYFPFWEYSSYGRNAGMTSRRMSCRELELRAGISAENQMGITSCAAASVLLSNENYGKTDYKGQCEKGYTALNLNPETDLGPFRDRPVMSTEHIRTRQATAWTLCVSPPFSATFSESDYKHDKKEHLPTLFNTVDDVYVPTIFAEGGDITRTWGIHPGFYTRYAYVPTIAGGIRRAKHYGEPMSSSVCREWWHGAKIDLPGLNTCPAWSQRTCNSLGDEFKFAVPSFTDLSLGENILDIVPRNFVWWNSSQDQIADDAFIETLKPRNKNGVYSERNDISLPKRSVYINTAGGPQRIEGGVEEIRPIVEEADAWINVRSTGAPGFAEGIAALIAIIASFAYLPIMLGAVGGLALANIAVALLVGSSPVWILACVFKKARVFAVSMGKYLFAALSAKLIVFMVLVLYTFMFSIISSWGSALGYSAGHIVLLMWAGAVPLICMLLLNWVSKHQAWKSTDGYSPMSFAGMMKIGGASDVRKREVGRYTTRAKRIAGKATGKLSVNPSSLLDRAYNKASRHPETGKTKDASAYPATLALPVSSKTKVKTRPKTADSKTRDKQKDVWDDDIKIVQEMRQSRHEQLLKKAEKTGDVSVDDIHKSGLRYYRSVYAAAALVAMKQGAKVSSSVLKQILGAASIKPKSEKPSDVKSKDKRKAKPQQKETKSMRADMLARNKAHREFKEDADKLIKAVENNDIKGVEASAVEILKRESAAKQKDKRAEAKRLKENMGTGGEKDGTVTGHSGKKASYDDSDELPIWEHPSHKKTQKGLGAGFTTEIGKKGKQKIAIPVSSEESDTLMETDEDSKVQAKPKKLSDSAKVALRENQAFSNMRDYRKALKSARKEGDVKGRAFKAGHKYYISVAASAAQIAGSAKTDSEISEIRDMLKRISPRKTRKPSNEMVIRKHFHSKNKLLLHKLDRALAAKNPKMIKEASEKLYKQMQQKAKQSPRVPKDYLL